MEKYRDEAIKPTSLFFEPAFYDYFLRLKANRFGMNSTYLACYWAKDNKDGKFADCADQQSIKQSSTLKDNLLTSWLRQKFSNSVDTFKSDDQISAWFASGENAKKLLNLRFGAHVAFGFSQKKDPPSTR